MQIGVGRVKSSVLSDSYSEGQPFIRCARKASGGRIVFYTSDFMFFAKKLKLFLHVGKTERIKTFITSY